MCLSEYLEKLTLLKKLIISYFIVDQGFAESNEYLKKNKDQKNKHYHMDNMGCEPLMNIDFWLLVFLS